MLDYKNWEITNLDISPSLYQSNSKEGHSEKNLITYTYLLRYQNELVYAYNFIWEVNPAETEANLLYMERIDKSKIILDN